MFIAFSRTLNFKAPKERHEHFAPSELGFERIAVPYTFRAYGTTDNIEVA